MSKRTPENKVKKPLREGLTAAKIFHQPYGAAMGTRRGFPDRFAIICGLIVWFEVKAAGKNPTPEQAQVHRELRAEGAIVFVVWPHNIQDVVRLCVELRDDRIRRGLGGPSEEYLFPPPPQPPKGARRNTRKRPVRPTLSRGADNPEQRSFAASIGYQGTQSNTVEVPLATKLRS